MSFSVLLQFFPFLETLTVFELFQLFAEFHSLCLFALLQFFSFLEYVTLLGLFQVLTGFVFPAPPCLLHCAGWPEPLFRPYALPPPFGLVQSADFACAFCAGFEAAPLFLSLCFPACTSGARDTRAILQIKIRNTLMNFSFLGW